MHSFPFTSISVRDQSCPNELCLFYQKERQSNVVSHSRKQKRLRCTACGKTWVICRKKDCYRLHTDFQTVEYALSMMKRGMSVRKIASIASVSPTTIQRWKTRFYHSIL